MSSGAPSRAQRRRIQLGTPVPESPDVAEASLAGFIGEAVALHLARLLQDTYWRPACITCARDAKRAEHEHQVAAANAEKAAEPPPEPPEISVSSAFTHGPDGPVCWAHFEPGE